MSRLVGLVGRALFVPRSAWPLAIARIVLGLGVLGWAVTMMFDVSTLLSPDGLVGTGFAGDRWHWVDLDSTGSVWFALMTLTAAAVMITIGFRPTVFLVVAFVLLVAVQRRAPIILNSGDVILRDLTLLLALTPSGAALSVDRWRRHGRRALRSAPLVAPWGMRLVQLQVVVVYFFAFWGKSGPLWREGTAVSTALRLDDLARFGRLDAVVENVAIVALLTWGTLALELALATGLWFRRLRPGLIVGGLALHVLIDTFLLVGFFGIAMAAGLMTFLDGDRIEERMRRRGPPRRRSRCRSAGEVVPVGGEFVPGPDRGDGAVEEHHDAVGP